jgi:hypothetical protein
MPVGGGETNHTYEITWVPEACKTVSVGQRVRLEVVDPPPLSITLNYSGACVGIIATLVS